MADTKKLLVLKALTALLEGINPANVDPATDAAYAIDMSAAWFRGKLEGGEEMPDLFGSILEMPRTPQPAIAGEGSVRSSKWQLLIQGFVPDDKLHPTDPAYDIGGKIEQRLVRVIELDDGGDGKYPEHFRLAGLINDLIIGEGIVRPPQQGISSQAFYYLPVTVDLTTNLANPYEVAP
jgi:hypothetical protein